MIWDIAAGVIIGGLILGMIKFGSGWKGIGDDIESDSPQYREAKQLVIFHLTINAVGVALAAWIIFFKAHW